MGMMGRPQVVSDEQIVARARAVFLERGYAASTQSIAAAVGVSWGAIARRFASKRALFTCAMAGPAEACGHAALQGAEANLPALLEQLRADLWERWPRHLQYRLATPPGEPGIGSPGLLGPLAQALEARALPRRRRRGKIFVS